MNIKQQGNNYPMVRPTSRSFGERVTQVVSVPLKLNTRITALAVLVLASVLTYRDNLGANHDLSGGVVQRSLDHTRDFMVGALIAGLVLEVLLGTVALAAQAAKQISDSTKESGRFPPV